MPHRPASPQRIASLLSSATEMLFAIEAGDRVVAVSHECDFPPTAASLPRITRTRIASHATSREIDDQVKALLAAGEPLYEVDSQLLAELSPELIVTQAQCDVCAVRYDDVLTAVSRLPQLAGSEVLALNPQSIANVLNDIRRLGVATGCTTQAEQTVDRLQTRIDHIRSTTATLPVEQRVGVGCIEWIEPVMVAANWMPEMIDWSGGRQPLTQAGRHSQYTAWDDFLQFDPEVIVVMPCGFDLARSLEEAAALKTFPDWHRLRAVRHGRVYAVDGNQLFNRAGPRLIDSLELLAGLLHPEKFAHLLPPAGTLWQRFGND